MSTIRPDSPSARLLAAALVEPFTLIDVGCSGGIDPGWSLFGEHLRAFAFDPGRHEIDRLVAAEARPGVRYVNGFVGLPPGHPAKGASVDPWRLDPWGRLAAYRTQQLQQTRATAARDAAAEQQDLMARNLWREASLADAAQPIILPDFLKREGVRDVDFIKIDVDGTDFEILQSMEARLADPPVLGALLEVNFFGGADPQVNSFHNVDRFMRAQGFDLFDLTVRSYSLAALPRPYLFPHPLAAQTTAGRPWQGDALYLRDLGYPFAGRDDSNWAADKLLKLAALFAATGLLDHAAELLLLKRDRLASHVDIDVVLDLLARESQDAEPDLWAGCGFTGYRDYIAAFEADNPAFYGALERRAARSAVPAEPESVWLKEALTERDLQLAGLRRQLEATTHQLNEAMRQAEAAKPSRGWKSPFGKD